MTIKNVKTDTPIRAMKEPMWIKGIPLDGNDVKKSADKSFTIVGGRYELKKSFDTGEDVEKLILSIEFNGAVVDYYINMTSQKYLTSELGRDINAWIAYEGEFLTKSQRVGKNDKEVIYIVEK